MPMTRQAHLLRRTQLDAFSRWLEGRGWRREPIAGSCHEVARFRHARQSEPMLVFERLRGPEYLTVFGAGVVLAKRFLVGLQASMRQRGER